MPKATILVTGNAGFIGSHLTKKLLNNDYRVVGVDNFNDYYDPKQKEQNIQDLPKKFIQYRLDILDWKKLKEVFQQNRIDIIVHLAARAGVRPSLKNPRLYQQVNVQGTKNLLQLAQQFSVKQFIFASSSSVYSNQKKIPFSETDRLSKPLSPYAATKQAGEKLCLQFSRESGIPTTILRFFTVYGPGGRPDMAPYLFTRKILTGQAITKYGDGTTKRDYTYIDDVVSGIVKAIENPFASAVINLGNNRPVSLNNFIKLLEKLAGQKARLIPRPLHPADVPQTCADITQAKKLLHWQPEIDLQTGLKKFIKWFKLTQPVHNL